MGIQRRPSSPGSPTGPLMVAALAGSTILLLLSLPALLVGPRLAEIVSLLNTSLILISGTCLGLGRFFIAQGRVTDHRRSMITATVFAALFLVVYVARWAVFGTKGFSGQGLIKALYLLVLGSHVLLAIALVPLVGIALGRALRGDFLAHRRMARLAFPLWLYVVLTGWVIYWMLYRL